MSLLKNVFLSLPNNKFTRGIEYYVAQASNARQCYCCKKKFSHFRGLGSKAKNESNWLHKIQYTDSFITDYHCIYCRSNDRIRHLMLYFDKMNFWDTIKKSNILHIAPERVLVKKIKEVGPLKYTLGDLNFTQRPHFQKLNMDIEMVDVTNIPFPDASYDIFISMHVLEHVPDYKKAFSEIYRVLKPNGTAILQVPISNFLSHHFSDESIKTDEDLKFFYGTAKHLRVFSEKQYIAELEEVGFKNSIVRHNDVSTKEDAVYYGLNTEEALLMFTKK